VDAKMTTAPAERDDASGAEPQLYDAAQAAELERLDRAKPYPGGEPACPACGTKLVRHVEAHPYPREDSPFRVRLACPNPACRRWTLYAW
jgi:hypothetical protein